MKHSEKILIVTAHFNPKITQRLKQGAMESFLKAGWSASQLIAVEVPGAVEIPLAIQWAFESPDVVGAVALGAVVRGETYHFESVCMSVERGCSELMLKAGRPIGFGVIMTNNLEQSLARTIGKQGNKGKEAADVVIEMLQLRSRMATLL